MIILRYEKARIWVKLSHKPNVTLSRVPRMERHVTSVKPAAEMLCVTKTKN